jgi:hypothetical protein
VSDRNQKRRAEDCVDNLRGVRDVHNQLRVQQQGQNTQGSAGTSSTTSGSMTSAGQNNSLATPTVSGSAKS